MAIGYDARTAVQNVTSGGSWTHTPSGTPSAAVVRISQRGGSGDDVSGVTYGGIAMTRVNTQQDNAGEMMRSYIYELLSGVPAGAQTVAVSVSASVSTKFADSVTLTVASGSVVQVASGTTTANTDVANPNIALSIGAGEEVIGLGVLTSGQDDVTSVTEGSGMTAEEETDSGLQTRYWERTTSNFTGAGTLNIGWTATIEDTAACAVAYKELASSGTVKGLLLRGVGA